MTGGYDKRVKRSDPLDVYLTDNNNSVVNARVYRNVGTVTSYRSNPTGIFIPDYVADPYGYFIQATQEQKRKKRSEHNLFETEDPSYTDSFKQEVTPFVDTGHPFEMVRRTTKTSVIRPISFRVGFHDLKTNCLLAQSAVVNPLDVGLLPFGLGNASPTNANYRTVSPVNSIPLPSTTDLETFGSRAIRQLAPGRPSVNVLGSLGELLIDFPKIPLSAMFPDKGSGLARKGKKVKSVGDDYLNYIFGIAPTVGDAIKVGKQLLNLSQSLLQLQRDAGRLVRRSLDVPTKVNSLELSNALLSKGGANTAPTWFPDTSVNVIPGSYLSEITSSSTLRVSEETTLRFSGSFSYYIPTPPGFSGRLGDYVAQLDRLIGLGLTPETVWQLTPWSWLIDWVADISSSLKLANVAFDDNLVINYGYAMQTTKRTVQQRSEFTYRPQYNEYGPKYVRTSYELLVQKRIRANPYGFLNNSAIGLNPMRWSILAALGISRLA